MSNLIGNIAAALGNILDLIPFIGWTGSLTVPGILTALFVVAVLVAKALTIGAAKRKYRPLFYAFSLACCVLFFYWAGDNLYFNFPVSMQQIEHLYAHSRTVPPTGSPFARLYELYSVKTTINTKPVPAAIWLLSAVIMYRKGDKDKEKWSSQDDRDFYICLVLLLLMSGYLAIRTFVLTVLSPEQIALIKSW
jgi:hypothetical protein